jgi:hypothetical protein
MISVTDLLNSATPDAVTLANRADAPYVMLGACFVALGASLLALAGWIAYAAERALNREMAEAIAATARVDLPGASAAPVPAPTPAIKSVSSPMCNCADCLAKRVTADQHAAEAYLAEGVAARTAGGR